MYRHRNRPKYSDAELKELYATPHDHTRWPDHISRVEKTIEVGLKLLGGAFIENIADLSCGDAHIAGKLQVAVWKQHDEAPHLVLGDYAPGYQFEGPIEETIDQIPHVDLFIFSESAEHLDNPDEVLAKIRLKADMLLMSTPNCSWPDPNPEHYWSYDSEAVRQMLKWAGWLPTIEDESYHIQDDGQPLGYRYQIWAAV